MTTHTVRPKSRRRVNPRKLVRYLTLFGLLALISAVVILPITWGLIVSLMNEGEYVSNPLRWLPEIPQFVNYYYVFTYMAFMRYAGNTLFLAVSFSVLTVFSSSMVGFAFARIPAPGRNRLFQVVVALLIIPNLVYIIPQFMLFSKLGLTNTYWPWILWGLAASPFHIFLFRQFFSVIPRELEDAAEVDGANPFRIFWQIFLPNAKPALAISFIFNFQFVWSDFFTPIIYLNDRITTLAVKLASAYVTPQGQTVITVVIAASVVYTLPLIILFFLAQKQILQGVVTSGLKG